MPWVSHHRAERAAENHGNWPFHDHAAPKSKLTGAIISLIPPVSLDWIKGKIIPICYDSATRKTPRGVNPQHLWKRRRYLTKKADHNEARANCAKLAR
jgi:hypothetical protein